MAVVLLDCSKITWLRENGQAPTWHYHLVDVETLAAGALKLPPPWNFDLVLDAFGLKYDEAQRHTALGDARMARDLCVEVTAADGKVLIRDSKNPDDATIELTADGWAEFRAVAVGWDRNKKDHVWTVPFDLEWDGAADDIVVVGFLDELHFTGAEWDAFIAALRAGEFDGLVPA